MGKNCDNLDKKCDNLRSWTVFYRIIYSISLTFCSNSKALFYLDLILDPRLARLGESHKPCKCCRKCFRISRVFCKAFLWIGGLLLTLVSIQRYIERYNKFESIDVMKTIDAVFFEGPKLLYKINPLNDFFKRRTLYHFNE